MPGRGKAVRILEWPDFIAGAALELAGGKKTALTVGVFDGIHRGHQVLLEAVIGKAPEMVPLVITFRKNPKEFFKKEGWEGDILSLDQKLAIFEGEGLPALALIDFSENFSKMPGKVFLEILRMWGNPGYIAVGSNFHCGYRMDTGAEDIRAFFRDTDVSVEVFESKVLDGGSGLHGGPVLSGRPGLPPRPISSSRIREAIRAGELREAGELLGRPVEIDLSPPAARSESGLLFHLSGRILPPPGIWRVRVRRPANGREGEDGELLIRNDGAVLLSGSSPADVETAWRVEFLPRV
jgi:riboflavin kinase/FMN adenylyltransferase